MPAHPTLSRAAVRLAVLVLLASPAAGVATPRAASAAPAAPSKRYDAWLVRGDTLAARGRAGGYPAYFDSISGAARANGDRDLEMAVSIQHASIRSFFMGELKEGQAEARRWVPHARSSRDTLMWCRALRTIGFVDLVGQRYPEAHASYAEMLRLSQRAHLSVMEGYAWIGNAYVALQKGRGREAERGYRRSMRLLTAPVDRMGARTARAGLANSLTQQGKHEDARREYEAVLAESRAAGDLRNAADALNDLGVIEHQFGDPSRALGLFRASAELQRATGRGSLELVALANVADCLSAIGRETEATALQESLLVIAETTGARNTLAYLLEGVASSRREAGRFDEAERLMLRAVAMGDSIGSGNWAAAVAEVGRVRIAAGRPAAARADLERALDARRVSPRDRAMILLVLGRACIATHDVEAALPHLREAASVSRGQRAVVGAFLIDAEAALGDAFRASGRRDSALAHYRLAAAAWEQGRAQPSDLAWRDAYNREAPSVYGRYVMALLDPARGGTPVSRIAEAFAALQAFRARTLEDALRGADAKSPPARTSLAGLRRALRPGDLFLDLYVAPDTSVLFAVTRDSLRVFGLPAESRLVPRLHRFRDLLAAADSDPAAVRAASLAIGRTVLGPVADLVGSARAVMLAAGREAQYPIGMLRLATEDAPIAAARQWSIVPSATLLAAARGGPARAGGDPRLLALCRTTDAAGERLEGVTRETRWLARTYPNTEVRENDGRRALGEMVDRLGQRDVLHVASHARGSAAAPWRAGFLLGRGDGEDAWLTASRIASLPRPARICVLAGCSSAGASAGAEAIPNLAAAWLTSGATAVVASLWPVGDEATAAFVEHFYRALFRGKTTGDALSEAQRAVSGRSSVSSRDWAGFVLIGDPATRLASSAAPKEPRAAR